MEKLKKGNFVLEIYLADALHDCKLRINSATPFTAVRAGDLISPRWDLERKNSTRVLVTSVEHEFSDRMGEFTQVTTLEVADSDKGKQYPAAVGFDAADLLYDDEKSHPAAE